MDTNEIEIFSIGPSKWSELGSFIWCGLFIIAGFFGFAWSWVFLIWLFAAFTGIRIFLRLCGTSYQLTSQRIFVHMGVVAKHVEEVELYRIKDIVMKQKFLERILKIGSVLIISTDDSTPKLALKGIADPYRIKEDIRNAYRVSRGKELVKSTEFIQS